MLDLSINFINNIYKLKMMHCIVACQVLRDRIKVLLGHHQYKEQRMNNQNFNLEAAQLERSDVVKPFCGQCWVLSSNQMKVCQQHQFQRFQLFKQAGICRKYLFSLLLRKHRVKAQRLSAETLVNWIVMIMVSINLNNKH